MERKRCVFMARDYSRGGLCSPKGAGQIMSRLTRSEYRTARSSERVSIRNRDELHYVSITPLAVSSGSVPIEFYLPGAAVAL